ncbi:MAG: M23 family metallopeptidase [Notoacmeibacter sp.]|nr:M23 family metallopeptidase [Notoacmeibacter sp.]
MKTAQDAFFILGDEPPLVTDERKGPPDRREVSARWLTGTFLTGLTSCVLMGVALFAALDGREQLATPPEILALAEMERGSEQQGAKAERVVTPRTQPAATDRRRMEVSTVSRSGDRDLVRTLPFVDVKMALAAGHTTDRDYPRFNPLEVFSEGNATTSTAPTGTLYGAKVESEVALRTVDFALESATFDEASQLSSDEVEEVVRTTGAILTDGAVHVAALPYVNPQRFGDLFPGQSVTMPLNVKIVRENVSIAARRAVQADVASYGEEVIPVHSGGPVADVLAGAGFADAPAAEVAEAIARQAGAEKLKEGMALRLGIESRGEETRIVRASLYEGMTHLVTVARDDRGVLVASDEPGPSAQIAALFDSRPPPVRVRGDLPTIYDGIYRAAFSYGLDTRMTKQLVRMLAADVDFQSRLNPSDSLQVFFSRPDSDNRATEDSQILYVKANFSGNSRTFYRYRTQDGTADYYDDAGRSARQFLLRNPVPNGKFRSGFGPRRHPILGYVKMHTGADWAAPRGTPIIAAGNGKVEKAGWSGGYGRQTIIRHANGYETSYSHQSAIAEGVVPGARIRQGQIIGYVGSTGLSTGPHLHYELMVNGTKVDPMRVRLPTGKVLKGEELAAFENERKRIDQLLQGSEDADAVKVAAATQ